MWTEHAKTNLARARQITIVSILKLISEIKTMLLHRRSEDGASISNHYKPTIP